MIDLDGSMKPKTAIKSVGVSTLVGSDDGRLLEFVEVSKCVKVETGCYSYCSDTCFRSIRFELDVPAAKKYSLKVCLRNNHSKCTTYDGGRRAEAHSYTIIAHLPVGNTYDAIFVSADGKQASPSFQQTAEEFFCPIDSIFDMVVVKDGMDGITIKALPRNANLFQRLFNFLARILEAF
jgi:hypothetical protein